MIQNFSFFSPYCHLRRNFKSVFRIFEKPCIQLFGISKPSFIRYFRHERAECLRIYTARCTHDKTQKHLDWFYYNIKNPINQDFSQKYYMPGQINRRFSDAYIVKCEAEDTEKKTEYAYFPIVYGICKKNKSGCTSYTEKNILREDKHRFRHSRYRLFLSFFKKALRRDFQIESVCFYRAVRPPRDPDDPENIIENAHQNAEQKKFQYIERVIIEKSVHLAPRKSLPFFLPTIPSLYESA